MTPPKSIDGVTCRAGQKERVNHFARSLTASLAHIQPFEQAWMSEIDVSKWNDMASPDPVIHIFVDKRAFKCLLHNWHIHTMRLSYHWGRYISIMNAFNLILIQSTQASFIFGTLLYWYAWGLFIGSLYLLQCSQHFDCTFSDAS